MMDDSAQRSEGVVSNLKFSLRALRHKNYRLFFIGQGTSLIGTWMQSVAMSWMVYRISGSPFILGMVGFFTQIPVFILSPVAGVLGDRWDRRRILVSVQVLAMLQAFTLSILTLTSQIRVWQVILLSVMLGIINSFEMPSRQAFVIEMIDDKSDLPNAIALNSSLFNASRMIGPAVAGVLVAVAGEGVCFLINGVSYIAAIVAFASMNVRRHIRPAAGDGIIPELKDGFRYAMAFRPIRDILALIFFINLAGMMYYTLIPVFAKNVLHGNSHTYGMLVSSSGAGALIATLYLASRRSVLGIERIMRFSVFAFGFGLILFSYSIVTWLSMLFMFTASLAMIVTTASCNTVIQTIVDENRRGRVMSFYIMAFMGAAPLGSLIAGFVSSVIGVPVTVFIGGVLCIIAGMVYSTRIALIGDIIISVLFRNDASGK